MHSMLFLNSIAKKSNIDVPRLISEAVSKSPNVKTFLHVSSMGQNNKDTDVVSKTKVKIIFISITERF